MTRIQKLIQSTGGTKKFIASVGSIPKSTVDSWSCGRKEPPEWATDLIEDKLKET